MTRTTSWSDGGQRPGPEQRVVEPEEVEAEGRPAVGERGAGRRDGRWRWSGGRGSPVAGSAPAAVELVEHRRPLVPPRVQVDARWRARTPRRPRPPPRRTRRSAGAGPGRTCRSRRGCPAGSRCRRCRRGSRRAAVPRARRRTSRPRPTARGPGRGTGRCPGRRGCRRARRSRRTPAHVAAQGRRGELDDRPAAGRGERGRAPRRPRRRRSAGSCPGGRPGSSAPRRRSPRPRSPPRAPDRIAVHREQRRRIHPQVLVAGRDPQLVGATGPRTVRTSGPASPVTRSRPARSRRVSVTPASCTTSSTAWVPAATARPSRSSAVCWRRT